MVEVDISKAKPLVENPCADPLKIERGERLADQSRHSVKSRDRVEHAREVDRRDDHDDRTAKDRFDLAAHEGGDHQPERSGRDRVKQGPVTSARRLPSIRSPNTASNIPTRMTKLIMATPM